jgi:hypothetical protein
MCHIKEVLAGDFLPRFFSWLYSIWGPEFETALVSATHSRRNEALGRIPNFKHCDFLSFKMFPVVLYNVQYGTYLRHKYVLVNFITYDIDFHRYKLCIY